MYSSPAGTLLDMNDIRDGETIYRPDFGGDLVFELGRARLNLVSTML